MTKSVDKRRASSAPPLPAERFQSLLVAIDLTAISDRVVRRITRLPLAKNASISVLHVVPQTLPVDARARALRDARKLLRVEVANLRELLPRGVAVEAIAKIGNVPNDVARTAKSVRADLIVVGRGGARALRDSFLGSTAERVIRAAGLPVLVVRLPARSAYRRPALAVEFDDAAASAIANARRLLALAPPRITAIHAVDSAYRGLAYPSLSRDSEPHLDAELELRATRKIAKLFEPTDKAQPRTPADLLWKPVVRVGSARMVIPKEVKRADSDLLVLGTAGRRGIAHVLLGTVAGDVLREVECDVLLVPPHPQKSASRRQR